MLLSEHVGWGQIIINSKQWRCKMKISQAIESYKDYHSINSKKKYGEKLWVCLYPVPGWIWWQVSWCHHSGWDPFLSDQAHWRNQTINQTQSLFQPQSLFQLHQKLYRSQLSKSVWHTHFEKNIQRPQSTPMAYFWKGVYFTHSGPDNIDAYRQVFKAPIRFEAKKMSWLLQRKHWMSVR